MIPPTEYAWKKLPKWVRLLIMLIGVSIALGGAFVIIFGNMFMVYFFLSYQDI
jgi:hypothetical protein